MSLGGLGGSGDLGGEGAGNASTSSASSTSKDLFRAVEGKDRGTHQRRGPAHKALLDAPAATAAPGPRLPALGSASEAPSTPGPRQRLHMAQALVAQLLLQSCKVSANMLPASANGARAAPNPLAWGPRSQAPGAPRRHGGGQSGASLDIWKWEGRKGPIY